MKKIIIALFVGAFGYAQDSTFVITKDGFTDYVVGKAEGKTQQELFKKAIDWVNVTYKNPKEVIKAQIENDYIRIEGSSLGLVSFNILGKKSYESRYQVEISFKEGKYKFDVISVEYYTPASQYGPGGWNPLSLNPVAYMYNKSGEVRSNFKYVPESLTTYFNGLNKELQTFLNSNSIPSKKSEW